MSWRQPNLGWDKAEEAPVARGLASVGRHRGSSLWLCPGGSRKPRGCARPDLPRSGLKILTHESFKACIGQVPCVNV